MNKRDFPFRLYLVTDEAACLGRDFFWVLEQALKGGVDLVQIREKSLSLTDFMDKALRAKAICSQYNVPLIVNDNWQVAKAIQADGLHIGQSDAGIQEAKLLIGPGIPVGLSLETMDDLEDESAKEAWYFGVSPVFRTPTKQDTRSEWGLEGLQRLRSATSIPLVAIGNVKEDNTQSIINAGADAIAVVSGICSAPDPAKAAENFRNQIEKAV
ncbi:thiamine-phosphate synthase [Echinicola pacifica]|uniref:Thiamine-phosphate synthase n=1 Tax=Echinicola pacifica TaxID=346377 RepID=A0A918QAH1_9BACT|nr:thiamine phosphate synthase [Echinicola pacifica]GGZ36801.1 thiamine-phosphate synthase [Echinicola pacifica]